LAAAGLLPSTQPFYFISEPMVVLTGIMAAAGYLLERRAAGAGDRKLIARLSAPWARPFILFAVADVIIWQLVGAGSPATGSWVAAGNALIVAALATLWLERPLAYATLALTVLATIYALGVVGVPAVSPFSLAWLA